MCTAILTHGGNRTLSLLKERLGGGHEWHALWPDFFWWRGRGVEIIVRFWQIEFKGFFGLCRFWMQCGGGFSTAPPPSFLPDIPGRGVREREYLKRVSSASPPPLPSPSPIFPLAVYYLPRLLLHSTVFFPSYIISHQKWPHSGAG